MRRALIPVLAAAVPFLGAAPAAAEHCHPPAPVERGALGFRVAAGAEAATYRNERYEGEYQGASLSLGWEHRWLGLRAALPAYRIVRNGLADRGLGDLLVDARIPFARSARDELRGGLALAATLPTGDAAKDLGMGHVMLMPGLWISWQGDRAFVQAQLAYGRALAAGGQAHHAGGPAPIVNPMNASEIEGAASAGVRLHEHLRVRGGLHGAIPVAAEAGAARGVAVVGGDIVFGAFHFGVEGHVPMVGDPFLAKAVISVAATF